LYRFHISDCEVASFDGNGIDLPPPPRLLRKPQRQPGADVELADEIIDWSDWRMDVVDVSDSVVLVLPFKHLLRTPVAQSADIGLMRTML
jgi:hypothetical protein